MSGPGFATACAALGLAGLLAQAPEPPPEGLPMDPGALPASGPDVLAPEPGRPIVLFVNFDGAVLRRDCGNDARYDCSTLASRFDGYVAPFSGNAAQRAAIIQAARRNLEPFGVQVVSVRPPPEVVYAQVIYGGLGAQSFAGIAPYIDCGDQFPRDTSFSQPYFNANLGATIIVHEAGHTWGLEHVDALADNMFPVAENGSATFTDACHQIVANTDLDPGAGICGAMHQQWCPPGQENTAAELRYLFGPSRRDTRPPEVEITTPLEGSVHELPVVLDLHADLRDDLDPQLFRVELYVDEELVFDDRLWGEVDFPFVPPGPGTFELRIVARDPSGFVGEDTVSFEVVAPGTLRPPPSPEGCAAAGRPGPAGAAGLVLVLAGFRVRRRRIRRCG